MNELDRYAVSLDNMEVLRVQVEELEAWKAEELALMNPLMDYARSVCTGQLGCSITEWLVEDHKEQALEIERLDLACSAHERHRESVTNSGANLDAATQRYIESLEQELAALKAQPSGVVQWPDADEIMQMAFEEGQPSEDASGYYFELEEFDLFIQRLMEEVARLNQPASASDGRATLSAFTALGESIGLSPALQTVGELKAFKAGAEWKARAALSANHSEQVRQMVPGDDELYDLASSACQMALAHGVGEESFMALARTVRDRCAMLAAAPTLASGVPSVSRLDYDLLKLAMQGVKDQLASCEQALADAYAAPSAGSQKEQGE